MIAFLQIIEKYILVLFFATFPFLFLNTTQEPTEITKLVLCIAVVLPLLIIKSLIAAISKKLSLINTTYLIPISLITLIYIVSSLIVSPSKLLPFVSSLSTSTWIFLTLLYMYISREDLKLKTYLMNFTLAGSLVIASYVVFMYLDFLPRGVTTPAGNLLTTALFLSVVSIFALVSVLKEKKLKNTVFQGLSLIILSGAVIFLVVHLNSDQKPILLDNKTGLTIASKIAGNPQSLLLGVGPSNFIRAFTLEKPASINNTRAGNITFTSSSSFFMNLLTETGVISALAFLSIPAITIVKLLRSGSGKGIQLLPIHASQMILSVLLIFFPGSTSLLILYIILLSASATPLNTKVLDLRKLSFLILVLPLFAVLLSAFTAFQTLRAYMAENYYFRAETALRENDLSLSYNLQKSAIYYNPYIDKSHRAISQTSLLIASEMLKNENQNDDRNRETLKLVSQSIEEARISINLNPTSVLNWENLTRIYASLIGSVPGSDVWAVDIAKQTIKLDPNNPNHYFTLAQIYQKLGMTGEAKENLLKVLNLKPDYTLDDTQKQLLE